MPAPDPGKAVGRGQLGVGVLGDVADGKIIGEKRIGKAAKGDDNEQALGACRRTRQGNPCRAPGGRTDERHRGLHRRHAQRQNQRKVSKFGNHACRLKNIA